MKTTFHETLNQYLEQLSCTRRDLSEASGLSPATVSRYCRGERIPEPDSPQMHQLIRGLMALSAQRGVSLSKEELDAAFHSVQTDTVPAADAFPERLELLLNTLGIRSVELARALSYDPSYISRILSGSRRPGNIDQFAAAAADYAIRRIRGEDDITAVISLPGLSAESDSSAALTKAVQQWLLSGTVPAADSLSRFLEKLSDFDLQEYMKAIHFDDWKLPPATFHLPTSRTYTTLPKMMEAELDFMRTTVMSRSTEECILYSDMPMQEMAADPVFPRKWMFGMGMMLKKGLHLTIIHDVNRPFEEMMLGLESNIPLYMTGMISPYYLPNSQRGTFCHLLKVSGAAALEGSAIAGHHNSGKYVLYRSAEDVAHYRKRAEDLLSRALPLMDICRSSEKSHFAEILQASWKGEDRIGFCGSLPLGLIPEDLLPAMMERGGLLQEEQEQIRHHVREYRKTLEAFLSEKRIHLTVPDLSREQFEASPLSLDLSELFVETDIPYTYEEYRRHLAAVEEFASHHGNFLLEKEPVQVFHNISYTVIGDRMVIVSKLNSPAVHFVIHHKKMVRAFRGFVPPIIDREED